jgi:uncharacterized protein (DUF2336 family)
MNCKDSDYVSATICPRSAFGQGFQHGQNHYRSENTCGGLHDYRLFGRGSLFAAGQQDCTSAPVRTIARSQQKTLPDGLEKWTARWRGILAHLLLFPWGRKPTMTATASAALLAELDDAINDRSPARRVEILRQVTNLFLADADRLSAVQVGVFDDVLVRLIEQAEVRTLAQLSSNLSGLMLAPRDALRKLALHEDASVAAPVLRKSGRLSDDDLVEIANVRGQEHLLAISGREALSESLSDVLVTRGDSVVRSTLAQNSGARFSEAAYVSLVRDAERDDGLTEKLARRQDIPVRLLQELVAKASAKARARLLQAAPSDMQEIVRAAVAKETERAATPHAKPVDYAEAQRTVLELNRKGKLNDQSVNRFAVQGEYHNVVAALALLTTVPIEAIESLIGNAQLDGLIVACKASRLNWSTTTMIIHNRPGCSSASKLQVERAREMFETLVLSTAQQTIRIWSDEKSGREKRLVG